MIQDLDELAERLSRMLGLAADSIRSPDFVACGADHSGCIHDFCGCSRREGHDGKHLGALCLKPYD